MDLSDRDFYSEMIEDMREGAEVIDNTQGYEVRSYLMRFGEERGATSKTDPEYAMNNLLDKVKGRRFTMAQIRPETVLNLLEEGSPRQVDQSINSLLSQFKGRINLGSTESDPETSLIIRHLKPEYHPQIDEGTFKFRWEPGGRKHAEELIGKLEQEGLNAEVHELRKD